MEMFPEKAMILAAGYGTRLRPLTDSTPKALIELQGIPMIERVIQKLKTCGVKEIIVNTHYLSGQIEHFLASKDFGLQVKTIYEPQILGTGGAIKNVKQLFKECSSVLIHNVDVFSDCDLKALNNYHVKSRADTTLAVNRRYTRRPLLIDDEQFLIGRIVDSKTELSVNSHGSVHQYGFCGIYIIEKKIFEMFPEKNTFEIIPFLLSISAQVRIKAFDIGKAAWYDLGKLETLKFLNETV
jgi:NDP-sugar pyrophosphorylase family protein